MATAYNTHDVRSAAYIFHNRSSQKKTRYTEKHPHQPTILNHFELKNVKPATWNVFISWDVLIAPGGIDLV